MLTEEQLNDLRKRVLADEKWTQAELTEAVKQMIVERVSSFEAPAKSKTKPKSVNLDDLI